MSCITNLIAYIFTLHITLISIYYHNIKMSNIWYLLSLNCLANHSKQLNSDQAIHVGLIRFFLLLIESRFVYFRTCIL